MNGAPPSIERRPWLLLFVAVCLVAVNLRMTITGIGPLLDQIAADQGVSPAALGALGSVPLLAWALISPLAHGISLRIGMSHAVSWALVVLAMGTLWRSIPGSPINLWAGTALIGAGLAIGNVLLPAVIKHEFASRIPLVMGIYTALLSGAGSIGAGIVVPVSEAVDHGAGLGWRIALLVTGATIPFALGVWLWATRRAPSGEMGESDAGADSAAAATPIAPSAGIGRRIWSDGLAWLVAAYMGTQSLIFYVIATWFAPYLQSLGQSPASAGLSLMTFQLLGLAGSMLVPLASRGRLRRWFAAALPALGMIAWIGMLVAPAAMPLWILIGGPVTGAQLTTSVTLMALRARNRETASALSGMSQSVGYLIAAIGPLLFGLLHGLTGEWVLPFVFVWIVTAIQLLVGLAVGKPRFVLEAQ